MRQPSDDETLARTVTCPTCEADPGSACVTSGGHRASRSHAERWNRAHALTTAPPAWLHDFANHVLNQEAM